MTLEPPTTVQPPTAQLRAEYAQTSGQLLRQLSRAGYDQSTLELCAEAYTLAAELFSGMYRPSGKTFVAHLVGTASILAWLGAPAELLAAGLLHSAYTHGDFGERDAADREKPRREIESRVGPGVTEYLSLYSDLPWSSESMIALCDRLDELGPKERDIALLRLANELDDWRDNEVAWSGNAKGRGKGMARDAPVLVDMASRLGYPSLGSELERALAAHQAAAVPEHLLRKRQPVTVIASPSWQEGTRTVAHPRSADLLTDEELEFFKQNGYLLKPGLLEPEGMRRALEYVWSRTPSHFLRDDWTTWHGEVEDFRGRFDLAQSHGRFKLRGETRTEPFLLELLPRSPNVWRVAEQLLGHGLVRGPVTIRGLYATFPDPDSHSHRIFGHVDQHPFSLAAAGYLEDVEPEGGGTTVWPGSHLDLHREFRSVAEYDPLDSFEETQKRLNQDPGVEITGQAGDVVFWHPRLLHGPGRNRSRHVRQAILCDFRRDDIEEIQQLPTPDDVWKYWAI